MPAFEEKKDADAPQRETPPTNERHRESSNAERLQRAAALLREALRDDARLEGADVGYAAEVVERAFRVFFECNGGDLSVEDWVIREGLAVGESVYDIRAVVHARGKGKKVVVAPCQDIPEGLEIKVSASKLSEFAPGAVVIVGGELCRTHTGKKWEFYVKAGGISER